MTELLSIYKIECRHQGQVIVKDLSLAMEKGAIVGLLGRSGCGKTTALRAIAGFEPIYSGSITLRKEVVSRPGYTLAPEKRKLGMVFQDYALFPHLNVIDNVCFGLHEQDKTQRKNTANELLEMVSLQHKQTNFPHELSGGQQQRVALARALAPKPDVLLLDEPFSSLDIESREHLSKQVREILKQLSVTAILVTHDQHESFAICDYVGVMDRGHIIQWDTPYNLYHQPNSYFVADFIGQGSFLHGTIIGQDQIETEIGIIKSQQNMQWQTGTQVNVLFRPDDVVYDTNGEIVAKVINKAFKGAEFLYTLQLPTGGVLLGLFPSHTNFEIGTRVTVGIDAEHVVAFPIDKQ